MTTIKSGGTESKPCVGWGYLYLGLMLAMWVIVGALNQDNQNLVTASDADVLQRVDTVGATQHSEMTNLAMYD